MNDAALFEETLLELEGVVESIVRADDWSRRWRGPLGREPEGVKRAVAALVRAGCFPDFAMQLVRDERDPFALDPGRILFRRDVEKLARRFERLAQECRNYLKKTRTNPDTAYILPAAVGDDLAARAADLRRFLADTDPKRKLVTYADYTLFMVMNHLELATGDFHDREVADLLSEIRSVSVTVESLRQWRGRMARRLRRWSELLERPSDPVNFPTRTGFAEVLRDSD